MQNMFTDVRVVGSVGLLAMVAMTLLSPRPATAASAAEIDRGVDAAVQALYDKVPKAQALAAQARGILVFPKVLKGGFIFGGQYGEGALRKGGSTVGYGSIVAASYGLKAGVRDFEYALFFMTDEALRSLDNSEGFEVGVGPIIVVVDRSRENADDHDPHTGCLCLYLRPGRLDGRAGPAGFEDHRNRALTLCVPLGFASSIG
jgi:hypothetical protein